MSLFWRLFLTQAAVVSGAGVVMILTPLTLSYPFTPTEDVWLLVAAAVTLVISGLALRRTLRPLRDLAAAMAAVDTPGVRLSVSPPGPPSDEVRVLAASFDDMLDRLARERSAVARATLLAQEDERRRIARELHDEVGQSLTVVLLLLARLGDEIADPLRDDLDQARETARSVLQTVRDITSRLRPPVLDDLGITQALISLTAGLAASSQISVHRELDEVASGGPEVDLVLYRVAQEALTNVARHSGASTVSVGLRAAPTALILDVIDDGCGTVNRAGNGVTGMRERTRLVNGRLDITGEPGVGTRVRLEVPLN